MVNKKEMLIELLKKTYCRLKPSPIGGVGVFAVRDIPVGIDPFPLAKNLKWYKLNISDLKDFDEGIMEMVDDFYVIEKNGDIFVPECGLNGMDASFFLNHSKTPNVETLDEGFSFKTLRKINKGEELVVSYGTYDYKWKK